jgi:two-component system chemotaxis response regulator CheB
MDDEEHRHAQGLRAVRAAGGISVVQSPDEAFAPLMPATAVERGLADHVTPLAGIAQLFDGLGSRR